MSALTLTTIVQKMGQYVKIKLEHINMWRIFLNRIYLLDMELAIRLTQLPMNVIAHGLIGILIVVSVVLFSMTLLVDFYFMISV